MLKAVVPQVHRRYSSLRPLGSILDDFTDWLLQRGYRRSVIRDRLFAANRINRALRQRSCWTIDDITRQALRACMPIDSRDDPKFASTLRSLERYFDERGLLNASGPPSQRVRSESLLQDYGLYLESVRGFVSSTISDHLVTASNFLDHLSYEANPSCLRDLTHKHLEAFIRVTVEGISRESLQHEIAHLRSFLRFLAGRGQAMTGLETQIDTPRVYKGERLPHSLPWDTVRAFLLSIDRTTSLGVRDYVIFLLMATYGLRCSEIVALKLDDIQWRTHRLLVFQRKTASHLVLPLTDPVGEALVDYLSRGRPKLPFREVFVRNRAPAGSLNAGAVSKSFAACVRRSGLPIPFMGPHCLRHSYAVHLLRQGVPLKTIGDVLGHKSAESTCVYLRLAVEDLRDVGLCLPAETALDYTKAVRP
jgi:integrase/recombinase XerD